MRMMYHYVAINTPWINFRSNIILLCTVIGRCHAIMRKSAANGLGHTTNWNVTEMPVLIPTKAGERSVSCFQRINKRNKYM